MEAPIDGYFYLGWKPSTHTPPSPHLSFSLLPLEPHVSPHYEFIAVIGM